MKILLLVSSICTAGFLYASDFTQEQPGEREWVDQVYAGMSLDEKIGQLFMPRSIPGVMLDDSQLVTRLIQDHHIGGVIFMGGDVQKMVQLVNQYQETTKVPLLVGMDAEHGVAMRMQAISALPQQLMLGAIQDARLIERYGKEVARQCARLGVHVNFAPVADVNNNSANPVIGNRSFGESVDNVTQKSIAYINGLRSGGVLGCLKHFPGHGDTVVDSHEALPVINYDKDRLNAVELVPFKKGIEAGAAAVMTAHLNIPTFDETPHIPSSLSFKIVTDLLVNELNFKGLIFTDGLRMHGVRKYAGNDDGTTELEAFKAGNTILLETPFVKEGCEKIKDAVLKDAQLLQKLEVSTKKILAFKYRLGLPYLSSISLQNIEGELLSEEFWDIKKDCINAALTYTGTDTTPLAELAQYARSCVDDNQPLKDVAMVVFNSPDFIPLTTAFRLIEGNCFLVDGDITPEYQEGLLKQLEAFKHVIVVVHGMNRFASKRFGILSSVEAAVKAITDRYQNAVVTLLGSPYALSYFKQCPHTIVAYNADDLTQIILAQKFLSGSEFTGKLPVSV